MSVIVKGMQMPKACMLCPIYDGEYGECGVLHDRYLFPFLSEDTYRYDATKEIHKDCPLVERPQGEWKEFKYGLYYCSRCFERVDKDIERIETLVSKGERSNYCSVCGADMRGDNDDG